MADDLKKSEIQKQSLGIDTEKTVLITRDRAPRRSEPVKQEIDTEKTVLITKSSSKESFVGTQHSQLQADADKTMLIRDIDKGIVIERKSSAFGKIIIAFLIIFIVIIGGFFLLFKQSQTKKSPNEIIDLSEEPIPLPFKNRVVGYNQADKTHPDKVVFTFKYNGGKAILYYNIAGIDSEKEVKIYLNGHEIQDAPLAVRKWSGEQQVPLPREYLTKTEDNIIIFDNTKYSPGSGTPPEDWGLKNVEVQEELLKPFDPAEAQRTAKLGDKKYEERKISYGNLYQAIRYYETALDYLEVGKEKGLVDSNVYDEIRKKLDNARQELNNIYEKQYFIYKRAMRNEDYDKAEQALQLIIAEIPDKRDPRNNKAVKGLEKIQELKENR